jgi:hypothetical protein
MLKNVAKFRQLPIRFIFITNATNQVGSSLTFLKVRGDNLKGLFHEIDFNNVDEN